MPKQKDGKSKTKEHNEPGALQRREKGDELGARLAATPFTFMRRFGEEMDRLFADFDLGRDWLGPVLSGEVARGMWTPQVEMIQHDGKLVVRADLPGLTKDDVKVQLTDDAIIIEGERRGEKEEKREGYYRSERSYGKFYRRLPIPEGVEVKNANATFNNGVLEITMQAPKREQQKPRRLEIRGEEPEQAKRKAA